MSLIDFRVYRCVNLKCQCVRFTHSVPNAHWSKERAYCPRCKRKGVELELLDQYRWRHRDFFKYR